MRLSSQIVVLLSLVLAAVFAGSFAVNVYHARAYLNQQLGAHAQDTATSLGLSMGQPLSRSDRAAIASIAGAIADRGYFRRIAVEQMNGAILFERKANVVVEGVPSWFVSWLPLQTPQREAIVMDGWKQGGKVFVSSHPGYAYKQLWEDARGMFWWFLGAWAVALILVIVLLRFSLAPLAAMERQALAICTGEFQLLERMPWTRELQRVAAAMNKMSAKVEESLRDKIRIIGRLEQDTHLDALTGLYNRSYFENHLESLMASAEAFETGALLLLRLTGLPQVNKLYGHAAGDMLLRQAAILLERAAVELQYAVAARAGGVELVLLVQEIQPDEALSLAQRLLDELCQARVNGQSAGLEKAHIGIGCRNRAVNSPGKLFAGADTALRVAQNNGSYGFALYPQTFAEQGQIHGAAEWRQILEQVLQKGNIVLHTQPVMSLATGAPYYREILARIPDKNGNLIAGGIFMPMARRMELALKFDYMMINVMLSGMDGGNTDYALHISSDAVVDSAFTAWLCKTLMARPQQAGRIILQLAGHLVADFSAETAEFITKLKSAGCRFGFSHVSGAVPSVFDKIMQFGPYLIKADAGYWRDLENSRDKRLLFEMLRDLARGMDSLLVIGCVETEQQLDQLRQFGIDAVQGKLLAPPQEMG